MNEFPEDPTIFDANREARERAEAHQPSNPVLERWEGHDGLAGVMDIRDLARMTRRPIRNPETSPELEEDAKTVDFQWHRALQNYKKLTQKSSDQGPNSELYWGADFESEQLRALLEENPTVDGE